MGDMVVEELWDIQQYKNMYVFDKKYICIKRKQKKWKHQTLKCAVCLFVVELLELKKI